jgi:NADH dehydrogenase
MAHPTSQEAQKKLRIVVVGGGVAGLQIATQLGTRFKNVGMVTLVDSDSAHVWKPMLHTIAAGTRDVSQQQTTYVAQARAAGFIYQPGQMSGLDRESRKVTLAPMHFPDGRLLLAERKIPYDVLIMAVGSHANDFNTPGVKDNCYMIDTRVQADAFNREVRARILQAALKGGNLSIAIVGGGATGVELAAELIQLADTAESYGTKGLASRIKITLIESGPRLLAAFPEKVSHVTKERLEELGVSVRIATRVVAAKENGYELDGGELIAADLMVWSAGVKAPDFLKGIAGLQSSRSNQLIIGETLQTSVDPNIFAVGDCASLTVMGATQPLPPTAQIAHQQAQFITKYLPAWLEHGKALPRFVPRDMGALVSLGSYGAFGSLGQFGLFKGGFIQGKLAQLSHIMLYRSHQAHIHGFWRGSLFWLVDKINDWLRPTIRLD